METSEDAANTSTTAAIPQKLSKNQKKKIRKAAKEAKAAKDAEIAAAKAAKDTEDTEDAKKKYEQMQEIVKLVGICDAKKSFGCLLEKIKAENFNRAREEFLRPFVKRNPDTDIVHPFASDFSRN
jgi:hypothetical protein